MKARIFLKPTSKRSRAKQTRSSRLLDFIFPPQQIQQMHSSMQDNGLIVLPKLRNLLFDEPLEDEQLAQLIRDNPLGEVDKLLVAVTEYFDKKVEEIVEPLEEENKHLLGQLTEVKEKLQNSMEDNEYFKYLIDRLEEDKKDVEMKLDRSESQIERSSLQCSFIVEQNIKMKSSVNFKEDENQSLMTENSQLKQSLAKVNKDLQKLQVQVKELSSKYYDLLATNRKVQQHRSKAEEDNIKLKQENDILTQTINRKQQFISSFLSQYNKIHFFQHHDSIYDSEQKNNQQHNYSHELKGFSFNQYEKQSIFESQHSSPQTDFDQTLHRVSVTAEKVRPIIQMSPKCCQSDRKDDKIGSNESKKYRKVQQELTYKKQSIKKKESGSKVRRLPKTNSCKQFKLTEGDITPPNSEPPRLNLEDTLKKKLKQKSAKAQRLQIQLNNLKAQFLEQLQRTTVMEGEYEIRIDELQQKMEYLNNELKCVYRKYLLANSQNATFEDKIKELEEFLIKKDEDHKAYCEQLKTKCKEYILERIDEVQQHHQKLLSRKHKQTQGQISEQEEQPSSQYGDTLNLSLSDHSKIFQTRKLKPKFSLKLDLNDERMRQDSSIDSYEHLPNHFLNVKGLTLDLDSLNNTLKAKEQIYVQDNFQIQSDIQGFTEGLSSPQGRKIRLQGNATDRPKDRWLRASRVSKSDKKLALDMQVIQQFFQPTPKVLIQTSMPLISITSNKKYTCQITSQVNEKISSFRIRKELRMAEAERLTLSIRKERYHTLVSNVICCDHTNSRPDYKISSFSIFNLQSTRSDCIDQYTQSEQREDMVESTRKELVRVSSFKVMGQINPCESITPLKIIPSPTLDSLSKLCVVENQQSFEQKQEIQQKVCEVIENSNYQIVNSLNESSCDSAFSKSQTELEPEPRAFNFNIDPSEKLSHLSVSSNKFTFVDKTKEKTKVSSTLHPFEKQSEFLTSGDNMSRKNYLDSQKIGKERVFEGSSSKSDLNKAMIWNSSAKKQLTQRSETVVEKNRMKYSHITQSGSPALWKQDVLTSVSEADVIPCDVLSRVFSSSLDLFKKFLRKHKLTLTFDQFVDGINFKQPKEKKRQLYVFKGRQKQEEKIFLLNNHRLFCLQDHTTIYLDKSKTIYGSNFMYGQSEVRVTYDGRLVIQREGKLGKLEGNIPDGEWKIESYIGCEYRVKK